MGEYVINCTTNASSSSSPHLKSQGVFVINNTTYASSSPPFEIPGSSNTSRSQALWPSQGQGVLGALRVEQTDSIRCESDATSH
ncbi:hypothetical protein PoB_005640800 [Plakobranchus ocellatus]|uniref:Uncharacterized protein n=1 Tax=Plakobranchus ocellatus TaxID=259542 RepID=A0AAV4CDC5_9GAST|nr:hypothetical protein PoB_005640800 [Plakobranchus ocellatus]